MAVLEAAALPRCVSKLGLGIVAGPAAKYAKRQGLLRKWMVRRVSSLSGNTRSSAAEGISFDAFLRVVDAQLRGMVSRGGLPSHIAGTPWL